MRTCCRHRYAAQSSHQPWNSAAGRLFCDRRRCPLVLSVCGNDQRIPERNLAAAIPAESVNRTINWSQIRLPLQVGRCVRKPKKESPEKNQTTEASNANAQGERQTRTPKKPEHCLKGLSQVAKLDSTRDSVKTNHSPQKSRGECPAAESNAECLCGGLHPLNQKVEIWRGHLRLRFRQQSQ